jgi:GDP-L-fucose synthase
MKNVLVTGGSGFLGKRLVGALRLQSDKYSIYSPSESELDLLCHDSLMSYFNNHHIDIVIHLAAKHGGVGNADKKALEYFQENLILNYNIVHSAIESGAKYFIMIASSSCYNFGAPIPTDESNLWQGRPENTYGICKLVMLEHLLAQSTTDFTCLIPPNYFGPGFDLGLEGTHIIPATIQKFENAKLNNIPYIDVWGDGSQIRDFVYIDDMVSILIKVLENEKFVSKIANVSTNIGTSIKDVVLEIRALMGLTHIDIRWDTTKPIGTPSKILCNKRLLQIDPSIKLTSFHEGIKNTIDWHKERRKC